MMLYIHIPFCLRKCAYCDFVSFAGREEDMARYVDAVIAEMDRRPCAEPVTSVFLGGGTPSLLPPEQLARLLRAASARYDLTPRCEITSEANPGAVTREWLDAAAACGVNRLSVGVQAAQPGLLRTLGRLHDFAAARETFALARQAGIVNLSADLMYSLPGQTAEMWAQSLEAALSLDPWHLSLYALTLAPGTPFYDLDARGLLPRPDEDLELEMLEIAAARLVPRGLFRYEVSNYAKPGCACRHNVGYWTRRDYIGLGCAAHSLAGGARLYNPGDLDAYLAGAPLEVEETLSDADAAFEELMLGLRLVEGVQLTDRAWALFAPGIGRFARQGLMQVRGRRVRLTAPGMNVMNAILAQLMP